MNSTRHHARKKRLERKPDQPAPHAAKPSDQRPVSKEKAEWRMRTPKRLVKAIFSRKDPVDVGTKLLEEGNDATVAKIYALFLEYLFGKPAQQFEARGPEGERAFRFVSYVPRPEYEVDPNSEDQRNKEACRQSLSGAPGAARTNCEDVTQEDENDQHE